MGFIYKITNTINGKGYVGVTTMPDAIQRFKKHIYAIYYGNGCPVLGDAVKKYGEEAFKFEVLIICFDEDVYKYEQSYIEKYNTMVPNGYNVQEGGKQVCTFLGKTHSEETKKILSEKSKEYNNRPEVKERQRQTAIKTNARINMGEILRNSEKWLKARAEGRIGGKKGVVDPNRGKKISESLKEYYKKHDTISGEKWTDSAKKKISDIRRKKYGRKVEQYTKENVLIATYDSIMEAHEKTHIHRGSIQSGASGRTKTGGGFIWKYAQA